MDIVNESDNGRADELNDRRIVLPILERMHSGDVPVVTSWRR